MACMLLTRFLFALTGLVAAGLVHAGGPDAAPAPCEARIDRIDMRVGGSYLPLAGNPTELPIELVVSSADGCRLALAIRSEDGGRLAGGDEPLEFQLRDDAGRVLAMDGGARLPIPIGTDRAVVTVALAPGQPAQAGRYTGRLGIQLLDDERVIDEREFPLTVRVQSQASVSLAGSAISGYSRTFGGGLDFGVLREGKEREAYLFVLANAAYALRLSSANLGRLRHIDRADTVGYTASIDGRSLDLSSNVTVEGRRDRRWLTLTPYRFNVRIGDVAGRAAGVYRDVVTVDVILLE